MFQGEFVENSSAIASLDNLDFDQPYARFNRENRGQHVTTFQSVMPKPNDIQYVTDDLVPLPRHDTDTGDKSVCGMASSQLLLQADFSTQQSLGTSSSTESILIDSSTNPPSNQHCSPSNEAT